MKIKVSKKQWEEMGRKAEQVAQKTEITLKVKAVIEEEFCSSDCAFLSYFDNMCIAFQTFLDKKMPDLPKTWYPQKPAHTRCPECISNEVKNS